MDDLNQLHGLATEVDAIAAPALPEATEIGADGLPLPAPPDYSNESAGAVDMFAALVVGYCPQAESIWTPETKGRIAGALAPVMEKYGMTFGTMPPEIMLLIVAGPPLWQSSKILAAQINADKEKAAKEAPAKVAAPKNPNESPLQEVHSQMGLYK